jgi:hypothetical protein
MIRGTSTNTTQVLLNGVPNLVVRQSHIYIIGTARHSTLISTIMEDFIADEVESILYIAREISGMP